MSDLSELYSNDTRLTNFSVLFGNDLSDFIATKVAPIQNAALPHGKYYVHNREDEIVKSVPYRAPGSSAKEVSFSMTTASYASHERALEVKVPLEDAELGDPASDPRRSAAEGLARQMYLGIEYDFMSEIDATSDFPTNHSTTLSGTDQWSDYSGSDPLGDVQDGKTQIASAIGHEPNILVLGYATYAKLLYHPSIVGAIKYTGIGRASLQAMAELFGVNEVMVAKAIYNSAVEGQTASPAFLGWSKDAWLFYRSPSMGLRTITFGWHMARPIAGAGGAREVVETRYDGNTVSEYVRHRKSATYNDVSTYCGYFIENAVA